MVAEFVGELPGGDGGNVEEDNIGLYSIQIDADSGKIGKGLGEAFGVGMVVDQPGAVILQGVEGAGGDNTGLSHSSAEHFSESTGTLNEIIRTGQGRADGCAETFGEADADGVKVVGVLIFAGA